VQDLETKLQTITAQKNVEEAAKKDAENLAKEHANAVQSLRTQLQTVTVQMKTEEAAKMSAEKEAKGHETQAGNHQKKLHLLKGQMSEVEKEMEAKKNQWQAQLKALETKIAVNTLAVKESEAKQRSEFSDLSERTNQLMLENRELQKFKDTASGAAAKSIVAINTHKSRMAELEAKLRKKDEAIEELKSMLAVCVDRPVGPVGRTKTAWELYDTINRVVIWVDDTPSNNQPYVNLVMKSGISVLQLSSTEAAIAFLTTKSGQALLASRDAAIRVITNMSRDMKDDEGIQLAVQLRKLGVDIPILIFTSKDGSLKKAREMRKASGLLNVMETNEAEKAMDFAYFSDSTLELRSPVITAASKEPPEFPSLDLGDWAATIEQLADMGYDNIQYNLNFLDANKEEYPKSTDIERITALVESLARD
jgi:hypothetical protein